MRFEDQEQALLNLMKFRSEFLRDKRVWFVNIGGTLTLQPSFVDMGFNRVKHIYMDPSWTRVMHCAHLGTHLCWSGLFRKRGLLMRWNPAQYSVATCVMTFAAIHRGGLYPEIVMDDPIIPREVLDGTEELFWDRKWRSWTKMHEFAFSLQFVSKYGLDADDFRMVNKDAILAALPAIQRLTSDEFMELQRRVFQQK